MEPRPVVGLVVRDGSAEWLGREKNRKGVAVLYSGGNLNCLSQLPLWLLWSPQLKFGRTRDERLSKQIRFMGHKNEVASIDGLPHRQSNAKNIVQVYVGPVPS